MNTKEKIAVMKAFEDGKKIECRPNSGDYEWHIVEYEPTWNWDNNDYRVFSEPKEGGSWERVEIFAAAGQYRLSVGGFIDYCSRVPGFGGIDYKSPFDPKIIVRSMVPLMFEPCGVPLTAGHDDGCRPGIPVAAWFWKEGEK